MLHQGWVGRHMEAVIVCHFCDEFWYDNGFCLFCLRLPSLSDYLFWGKLDAMCWEHLRNQCSKKQRLLPKLENEMATHSSITAWRIPWTEEPGELQSIGSQRVRHDWVTNMNTDPSTETYNHAVMEMQVDPRPATQGTWLQSQLTAWLKHPDRHWASTTQLRHSWIPDTLKRGDITHFFLCYLILE